MFNKILVPTDGSENSQRVLNYAMDISKKFKSEILILHIFECPEEIHSYPPAIGEYYYNHEIKKDRMEAGNKILINTKSLFEAQNLKVETLLEEGEPGLLIIKTVEEKGYDLVIMGSRGLSPVKSLLLGSVSNYVIHHSKVPVLLIH